MLLCTTCSKSTGFINFEYQEKNRKSKGVLKRRRRFIARLGGPAQITEVIAN